MAVKQKMNRLDYDIICCQIFKVTAKELRRGKKWMPQRVLESPLFYAFCESFGADPYMVAEGIKERAMNGCRIITLDETIRSLG